MQVRTARDALVLRIPPIEVRKFAYTRHLRTLRTYSIHKTHAHTHQHAVVLQTF